MSREFWKRALESDAFILEQVDERTKIAVARLVLRALAENAHDPELGSYGTFVETLGFGHVEDFRLYGQGLTNALYGADLNPFPSGALRDLSP